MHSTTALGGSKALGSQANRSSLRGFQAPDARAAPGYCIATCQANVPTPDTIRSRRTVGSDQLTWRTML